MRSFVLKGKISTIISILRYLNMQSNIDNILVIKNYGGNNESK